MPYNTLINIIFVLSVLGVILLVLRRLPEATGAVEQEKQIRDRVEQAPREALRSKGLPVQAFSKTKAFFQQIFYAVWQFLLEAKGLKQTPKISYGFKKILQTHNPAEIKPAVIKDENYYLELIKRNPKDKSYYDLLGQYYFEMKQYSDAAHVYEYLVKQVSTDSGYWAKFGLANLFQQYYQKAQEGYQRAISLDPTNPSRFYNLALSFQGQKDYRAAVEALKKATELEPGNKKYNDLLFEVESKAKVSVPVENIHNKE